MICYIYMYINHSYRVVHHVSYPNLWRFITMVTINCTPKNMKYGIYPVKYGIIATLELALNIHTSQLFSCDRTRDWDQTPVSEFRSRPPKLGRFSSLHARVTLRFGSAIWKAPGCSASHTTCFFPVLR